MSDYEQFSKILATARATVQNRMGDILAEGEIPELREPGWARVGDPDSDKLHGYSRNQINNLARKYYLLEPQIKHGINIHNVYTLGRGVSVRAKNDLVNPIIQDFWNDMDNRAVISRAKSQYQLNTDLMLDGEIFFVFFVSTQTGRVKVDTINPREITNVITAKGNNRTPLYYERTFKTREFNFESGGWDISDEIKIYYPDFRNADPDKQIAKSLASKLGADAKTEIYIYHACSNPFKGRGLSKIATAIPWVRAFKGFMEDRVTLSLALATFAFKQKIDGNAAAMQVAADQWAGYNNPNRYEEPGNDRERRQGANVLLENSASNLEQFSVSSGAYEAYQEARLLRQPIAIAMSLMEHYLTGDGSESNLATATAMELPMLKVFQYNQQEWSEILDDILTFAIYCAIKFNPASDVKKLGTVDIEQGIGRKTWVLTPNKDISFELAVMFPPIVERDVNLWLSSIASIAVAEAQTGERIIPAKEKAEAALNAINAKNVGALIEAMEDQGFAIPNFDPNQSLEQNAQVAIIKKALAEVKGQPLPDADAEDYQDITDDEMQDTLDNAPTLDDLLDELGIDESELTEAINAT